MLADACMSVASVIFTCSVIPQIKKVHTQRSAAQISWAFLALMVFAICLFIIGKFLVGCYIAGSIDIAGLIGYCVLGYLKAHYAQQKLILYNTVIEER